MNNKILSIGDIVSVEDFNSDEQNYADIKSGKMKLGGAKIEEKKEVPVRKAAVKKEAPKTAFSEKKKAEPIKAKVVKKSALTGRGIPVSVEPVKESALKAGDVIVYESKKEVGKSFTATVVDFNAKGQPRIRRKSTGRIGAVTSNFKKKD